MTGSGEEVRAMETDMLSEATDSLNPGAPSSAISQVRIVSLREGLHVFPIKKDKRQAVEFGVRRLSNYRIDDVIFRVLTHPVSDTIWKSIPGLGHRSREDLNSVELLHLPTLPPQSIMSHSRRGV